jgi:hypothetical protein
MAGLLTHDLTLARVCALTLVVGFVCLGCGGSSSNREPSADRETPAPPVAPSTRRIAWDQTTPTAGVLPGYTYTLYVDDAPRPLADVVCERVTGYSAYTCSAPLPALTRGRHVLRMATSLNGVESERSAPLVIETTAAEAPGTLAATLPPMADPIAACTADGRGCYSVVPVVDLQAQSITSPVALDAQRILMIEDGVRLRIAVNSALLPEPALVVETPSQITAVAVDPAFATSRFVYVALVEEIPPRRELTVRRFREVGETLGEGAAIVSGVSLPHDVSPQLSIDTLGRVYVTTASTTTGNGLLLRYMPDGSTPWSSGQRTPVLSEGYARATALAMDHRAQRLWLSGLDSGKPGLASLAWESHETLGLFRRTGPSQPAHDQPIVSLAIGGPLRGSAASALFGLDGSGSLFRAVSINEA